MGLDFGLVKMKKSVYEAANGDKDMLYKLEEENEENDGVVLVNYCGWRNIRENWFKNGLNYYTDYDGYLMRALTPEDIYQVILEATAWYDNSVNPSAVQVSHAFVENADNSLTVYPVSGIEVHTENGKAIRRIYNDDALFVPADPYLDAWDINIYHSFIYDLISILADFDWDNYVLLYYVSY